MVDHGASVVVDTPCPAAQHGHTTVRMGDWEHGRLDLLDERA